MLPQIHFSGHGVEITQTLNDFITEKFARLTKHAQQIVSIHVTLKVEKLSQIAEAHLHIPGHDVFAEADSEDMYKTVDLLIDKLVRQLDKIRTKNS